VGFKLEEGNGLREGWDSKELWKSVEKGQGSAFCGVRESEHLPGPYFEGPDRRADQFFGRTR
jgi:hypothetical protein